MALTAVLTQTSQANMGTPTNFTLAITNPSGAAINVTSIQPKVTTPSGAVASCQVSGPYAFPGVSVPQVGGSQFNVQVDAAATVYFAFQVAFTGAALSGTGAATPTFTVGADCLGSDGAAFSPGGIVVNLSRPVFGLSPGAPPNKSPNVGGVDFSTPVNSGLAL